MATPPCLVAVNLLRCTGDHQTTSRNSFIFASQQIAQRGEDKLQNGTIDSMTSASAKNGSTGAQTFGEFMAKERGDGKAPTDLSDSDSGDEKAQEGKKPDDRKGGGDGVVDRLPPFPTTASPQFTQLFPRGGTGAAKEVKGTMPVIPPLHGVGEIGKAGHKMVTPFAISPYLPPNPKSVFIMPDIVTHETHMHNYQIKDKESKINMMFVFQWCSERKWFRAHRVSVSNPILQYRGPFYPTISDYVVALLLLPSQKDVEALPHNMYGVFATSTLSTQVIRWVPAVEFAQSKLLVSKQLGDAVNQIIFINNPGLARPGYRTMVQQWATHYGTYRMGHMPEDLWARTEMQKTTQPHAIGQIVGTSLKEDYLFHSYGTYDPATGQWYHVVTL